MVWESYPNHNVLPLVGTGHHNAWHHSSTVSPCYQSYSQSTQLTARQWTYWRKHLDLSLESVIAWTEFHEAGSSAFYSHCRAAEGGSWEVEEGGMSLVRLFGRRAHRAAWAQRWNPHALVRAGKLYVEEKAREKWSRLRLVRRMCVCVYPPCVKTKIHGSLTCTLV